MDALTTALDRVTDVFRGMTAHSDEAQCDCHWGSPEELALLKTPNAPLSPDLLRRTWKTPDWSDPRAVLRRILPQLVVTLADGTCDDPQQAAASLALARWLDWPSEQSMAVSAFLRAWWAHTLCQSRPLTPAVDVFAACATASGTVTPWLEEWAAHDDPAADQHLLTAVHAWEYDLVEDELPWSVLNDEEQAALVTELNAWLTLYAPARLAAQGAPAILVHRMTMLGVPLAARWDGEHCPEEFRRVL